jgi:CubicO group peptidase (beta-lactamase class C family)
MKLRPTNLYTTASLFLFTLLSCQFANENANAHTHFLLEPETFETNTLQSNVSTSPEWAVVKQRIDSFYNRQVAAGFNGSVLVGYKGKIVYEQYYGIANRSKGLPLSEQASVQLASVSKTFTAAAILYLYQHKYLDINDLVSTYIPSFPYKNISIKMLLNHRSGLPDYTHWAVPYANRIKRIFYNDDIIKLLASVKPHLDFPSNTHFKYSNTNYAVLAKLIEIVTEMPYKSFMQKYIFKPLGMEHTFVFDPADGLPASASISYKYNWQAEPVMFADGVYGDKGIYSTARDMYKWDQSFYQNKLLNNETIELAYGPCSFEKAGVKNYGLGWRMLCFTNGNKIIYHNGWWHGNNTCFYRFIKENFTIIVLGNRFNKNIYKQPKVIYSIIKNTDASQGFDEDE